MKDIRPFILNAYWAWINESGCTPYIAVNCLHDKVQVPSHLITDNGTIILNISMRSAAQLSFDDDIITFIASFGGQKHSIYVPFEAVLTIYAAEQPTAGTNLYDTMPDEVIQSDNVAIDPDVMDAQKVVEAVQQVEVKKSSADLKLVVNGNAPSTKEPSKSTAKLILV